MWLTPKRIMFILTTIFLAASTVILFVFQLQPSCCYLDIDATRIAIQVANDTAVGTWLTSGGTFTPMPMIAETQTSDALIAAYQGTVVPTHTPAPTSILTPTTSVGTYSACGWQWATQDLPDVTSAAEQAFNTAGLQETTVRAQAYGENCMNAQGEVQYFAAMTTDFYVGATVLDLKDETLAGQVIAIYKTLAAIPDSALPARRGYLDITFKTAADSKHLRTEFISIGAALDKGLNGTAFIQAVFPH